MRLKAVYFKNASPTGLPYRKAMVYEKDVPWFVEKGAVLEQPTEADLVSDKPKTVVKKPVARKTIKKSGKKS